jgi:hypothetical protein
MADQGVPFELAEAALAHVVGNAVVQAYQRSSMRERRRPIMSAWANYVRGSDASNVVPLRRASGQERGRRQMSDDEDDKIAALNEAQARLAADLDEQLKRLAREGKLVGLEPLLGLISELQALVDKLLATAKEMEARKKRPN